MLMRIDAKYMDFLHTDTCLYVLIKQVKLSKKRTFKASGFFPRKKIESKSLADVQFLIDNCRLVSQSNYLNNFNKECDWLILACFIREQYTAELLLLLWKIKFGLKIQVMRGEIIGFFIIKQIKKARLCFVLLQST